MFGDDDAGGLVAQAVRVFDDHGADGAVFPKVHVGALGGVLARPVLFCWEVFERIPCLTRRSRYSSQRR